MAYFRQSKRRSALFLEDLLGQPCCPALTVKMQNQVSQALAEPYRELNGALADQPQVFMDESPTKEGPARAWLWTAVAPTFAVFAICLSRAATAIGQLLGDGFTGTINCDRAKMDWHVDRLQWCWAWKGKRRRFRPTPQNSQVDEPPATMIGSQSDPGARPPQRQRSGESGRHPDAPWRSLSSV